MRIASLFRSWWRPVLVAGSPVRCDLCQQQMPLALIAEHLSIAHGVDPQDIAAAEVVDEP